MLKLKPLKDQVIVLTGATSGIGLVTVRMAVKRGARVVLVARNEMALRQLADEIRTQGGQIAYTIADVGKEEELRNAAQTAIKRFGGFDTWVNGAAVSIYGGLTDIPIQDQRRLFETNFWGVVYGSRIAAEHLRSRGGALINIGSVLSDRSIPLQGIYCASKHAVKGYTDSLRMELEKEKAPISVTLIKPSAIDTPYKEHARNYLPVRPENPPPVYAPGLVARAILYCASHVRRDVTVGGGGRMITTLEHLSPRATDEYMKLFMFDQQRTDEPPARLKDSLYSPGDDLKERGGYKGHVAKTSLYTTAILHPLAFSLAALGGGMLLAALGTGRRPSRPRQTDGPLPLK